MSQLNQTMDKVGAQNYITSGFPSLRTQKSPLLAVVGHRYEQNWFFEVSWNKHRLHVLIFLSLRITTDSSHQKQDVPCNSSHCDNNCVPV